MFQNVFEQHLHQDYMALSNRAGWKSVDWIGLIVPLYVGYVDATARNKKE